MVPVMEGMSRGSDTSGDADGGGKGYALEKVDESKLDLEVPTIFFFFAKSTRCIMRNS